MHPHIQLDVDMPLENSLLALFIEEPPTQSLDSTIGQKAGATEVSVGLQFYLLYPNFKDELMSSQKASIHSVGDSLKRYSFISVVANNRCL